MTVDTLAITFSTDFTQRLTAPSTDTPKTIDFELSSVPLAGSWRARVTRSDADCALSVSTDAATFGYKPLALDLTVRLDASLDDGDVLPIAHGDSLPPLPAGSARLVVSHDRLRELEAASAGRYVVDTHRSYKLRVELNVHQGVPLIDPETLVRRLPGASSSALTLSILGDPDRP